VPSDPLSTIRRLLDTTAGLAAGSREGRWPAAQRQLHAKALADSSCAQARKLLVRWLGHEDDPEVLEWLCIGARRLLVKEATPALLRVLAEAPIGDVRRFACETLGEVGNDTCVPALLGTALNDSDDHARFAAVCALGRLGARDALRQLRDQTTGEIRRVVMSEETRLDRGQKAAIAQPSLFQVPQGPSELKAKQKSAVMVAEYLAEHAPEGDEEARRVFRSTAVIVRNAKVRQARQAENLPRCQLCQTPFFLSRSGRLFSEVAHIEALKHSGRDTVENTLVLCSWCHSQLDEGMDTVVRIAGDTVHIRLPSGVEGAFRISKGCPPEPIRPQ